MDIVSISAIIENTFSQEQLNNLKKHGWQQVADHYYEVENHPFYLSLQIKERFNYNIISCSQSKGIVKYVDMPSFNIEEAWKIMWTKNTELADITIYTLNNLHDSLCHKGWSSDYESFLIHPIKRDISFHIDGNPNQRFYRLCDSEKNYSNDYMNKFNNFYN